MMAMQWVTGDFWMLPCPKLSMVSMMAESPQQKISGAVMAAASLTAPFSARGTSTARIPLATPPESNPTPAPRTTSRDGGDIQPTQEMA